MIPFCNSALFSNPLNYFSRNKLKITVMPKTLLKIFNILWKGILKSKEIKKCSIDKYSAKRGKKNINIYFIYI